MIEKLAFQVPNGYKAEFHKKCRIPTCKDTLIISFSPDLNYSLRTQIESLDTLYLACDPDIFYLMSVKSLLAFIREIIKQNNYKKIILVGTSKGAFASCLYGSLLAKKMIDKTFCCLCFSPIFFLYPKRKKFKSNSDYANLLSLSKKNHEILNNLRNFGNIKKLLKRQNLKIYSIAGKGQRIDRKEIDKIKECDNVKVHLVELSSHFSIMAFLLKKDDVKDIFRFKRWLMLVVLDYFDLKNDENKLNKIATELADIVKNGNLLSLNEIFEILASGKELVRLTKDNND